MLNYCYVKTNIVLFITFAAFFSIHVDIGECNADISLGNNSWLNQNAEKTSRITLYRLDNNGIFHRCDTCPLTTAPSHSVTYSVLNNGVLIPGRGPYPLDYRVNNHGDLLPLPSNKCLYKSDTPAYYVKSSQKILIPVELVFSGNHVHYVFSGKGGSLERGKRVVHTQLLPPRQVIPDTGCNGEVTLFLLNSNGHLSRVPPDEYLPKGVAVSYQLNHDGVLTPHWTPHRKRVPTPVTHRLTYVTGEKGNLVPSTSNSHTLTTQRETSQSFILAEGGLLAPVSEALKNDTVSYFFDGRLVHRSRQFDRVFTNASVVYLTQKTKDSDSAISPMSSGPRFECPRRLVKRDTIGCGDREKCERKSFKQCAFVYDDKGKRIPLDPYINEKGRVAIYKVTCKGHLKRLDNYNEPESGFEVTFKLLDSYILVPITKKTSRVYLRYILQESGNLIPIKNQKFTFKKAPASMLYYVLTRNKELVPIRLSIMKDDSVELYYQECLIYTISSDEARHLEVFTTLYSPLYAYLNSRLTIIHHDPLPKPEAAGTWTNIGKSATYPCRSLYLVGPNKVKIKIEIDLNKNNVPVIYEMSCKGVCYKSPKDERKNIFLTSYKLVADGMILVPTNQSNGYMYLVDRQGDMYPYCYPETKLRAPHGLTVKYLLCKAGILLPILVEAVADHVRFSYDGTVIYYRRAYTIEETVDLIGDANEAKPSDLDIVYQKDGSEYVYFERIRRTLFRHPKKDIAKYLQGKSAYFNILPSGTLTSSNSPDTKLANIKIQVQKEGDIIIVDNPENAKLADTYLLSKNASLIPVQIERRDGYLIVYRGGVKITRIKYSTEGFGNSTTLNPDPMNLFHDQEPPITNTSCPSGPQQVTIPIDEQLPEKQKVLVIDSKKCALIRKTIQEMLEKDPSLIGAELEMNDSMVQDIFKMVCNCSSVKCPEWCKGRHALPILKNSPKKDIGC